jgi:hypothetical protein
MKSEIGINVLFALFALMMSALCAYPAAQGQPDKLAAPENFDPIGDPAARSAAIFTELGKVLTHPRCVNCHPKPGSRTEQFAQCDNFPATIAALVLLLNLYA